MIPIQDIPIQDEEEDERPEEINGITILGGRVLLMYA